jgi:hypothetical protein
MRNTLACLAAALLSTVTSVYGGIDLTPNVTSYVAEGITITQLGFKDGNQTISYEPPFGWTYRGGGSSLQLTPKNVPRADASIEVTPAASKDGLTDTSVEAARQRFLGSLPPQAETVSVVAERQNPLLVNNCPTYQIVASYNLLGEAFLRSVLVAEIDGNEFAFRLTARKADFDKLQQTFRSSIFSLRWPETKAAARAVSAAETVANR